MAMVLVSAVHWERQSVWMTCVDQQHSRGVGNFVNLKRYSTNIRNKLLTGHGSMGIPPFASVCGDDLIPFFADLARSTSLARSVSFWWSKLGAPGGCGSGSPAWGFGRADSPSCNK